MGIWDIVKGIAEGMVESANKEVERKQKQLQRDERQREISADYQQGKPNIKTTIVLSAPGQAEEKAGRPAAGQTGKNINRVLEEAHKRDPKRFPSASKDDYQIVNASD